MTRNPDATEHTDFEDFVRSAEPRLRRALINVRGVDGATDAVNEALAYAWENWDEVSSMRRPLGYLYRVAQSRTRRRKAALLPVIESIDLPEFEPRLVPALNSLTKAQRASVWLVHGCGWTYAEAAEAIGVSVSAVGTHVSRALVKLAAILEVPDA